MAETAEVTPAQRAEAAAEELAAEGLGVTAAAVRERSGVRMATASNVAKAWKEREKQSKDQPAEPVPDWLLARFQASIQAAWHEARTLSHTEFGDARAGWEAKLAAAEREVLKLTAAVEDVERECERIEIEARAGSERAAEELAAAHAQAAEQAEAHAAQLAAERSRADRAEGALEAVTAERDRLLAQLETVRAPTIGD